MLPSDFLDILFENRNKVYGAYELRRSYDKRIVKALCITGVAIGLILGSTLIARPSDETVIVKNDNDGFIIRSIEQPPAEPVEPPPPPVKHVEPPQIKMVDFVSPEVVEDDKVLKTPPEQADFDGAKIGDMDLQGVNFDNLSVPPPTINRLDIIEVKKEDPNEIWTGPIEIEAEFPGGAKEWEKFLKRNLQPDVAVDNNAAPGRYTVYIQFIVDKEGKVSDMKPLTAHGYGMEEEAIRVLRKATTWRPANQNGRAVKAYRKQPITFVVAAD